MQATITYLLSEQAQKNAMSATGVPIARKQTVTQDVPNDLVSSPLAIVSEDGSLLFDLSRPQSVAYQSVSAELDSQPESGVAAIAVIAARVEAKKAEQVQEKAQLAAAYRANTLRVLEERKTKSYMIYSPVTHTRRYPDWPYNSDKDVIASLEAQTWIAELDAEARQIQQTAIQANEAKVRKEKEKQAADELRKQAKLAYIAQWIAEYGTDSQKARHADGVLCRDEAIAAIADEAFKEVNAVRYTRDSWPTPKCTDETCGAEDCGLSHSVKDSVECLSDHEYAIYTAIRSAMPDDTKYVLRTHSVSHDCGHNDNCKAGENHSVLVKAIVGPFTLQREFALTERVGARATSPR